MDALVIDCAATSASSKRAPDADAATKVALLIRSFGRATAELWPATPWDRFVDMAKRLRI